MRGGGGGIQAAVAVVAAAGSTPCGAQDLVITGMKIQTEDLGAGDAIETRADPPVPHHGRLRLQALRPGARPRRRRRDLGGRFPAQGRGSVRGGDDGRRFAVLRRASRRGSLAETKKIPGVRVKTVTTQTIPIALVAAAESRSDGGRARLRRRSTSFERRSITALKEAGYRRNDS